MTERKRGPFKKKNSVYSAPLRLIYAAALPLDIQLTDTTSQRSSTLK